METDPYSRIRFLPCRLRSVPRTEFQAHFCFSSSISYLPPFRFAYRASRAAFFSASVFGAAAAALASASALAALAASARSAFFAAALSAWAVARSHGISDLARRSGVSRPGIYKALGEDGNPSFETIRSILGAMGLRLTVEPAEAA
jgi:probable addiction module antidote protein